MFRMLTLNLRLDLLNRLHVLKVLQRQLTNPRIHSQILNIGLPGSCVPDMQQLETNNFT